MDIKMPVLSGYDAIIEIKKIRSNLPIIAQTAFSSHEEIVKCQQLGVNDYVTKPIDINLLVIKINKVFNK
jgi:two-component system sensor histidine kinase EvgS